MIFIFLNLFTLFVLVLFGIECLAEEKSPNKDTSQIKTISRRSLIVDIVLWIIYSIIIYFIEGFSSNMCRDGVAMAICLFFLFVGVKMLDREEYKIKNAVQVFDEETEK